MENAQIFTGSVDVKPNVENGVIADRSRLSNSWNKMVIYNYKIDEFLTTSSYDYSNYSTEPLLYERDNVIGL
jgi:hypothetical protein